MAGVLSRALCLRALPRTLWGGPCRGRVRAGGDVQAGIFGLEAAALAAGWLSRGPLGASVSQ